MTAAHKRNRIESWRSRPRGITALVGALALTAQIATEARPLGPMVKSNAPFVAWHQGFEHDTSGWYDNSTNGPVGWCGGIEAVTTRPGPVDGVSPSAGTGYAKATMGLCNAFWTELEVPFGAPYAPGPGLALYSSEWPTAGYVTELDIWLDPAWSGVYEGNFAFAGSSPDTLVQFATTIFPLDPDAEPFHTGPHYFVNVDAVPGSAALVVGDHTVTTAGWYRFRFLFSEEGGEARVDFELAERRGPVLTRIDDIAPVNLLGPFKAPFAAPLPTDAYGSGHIWFFDIALGLELPIDEHRVRRGR